MCLAVSTDEWVKGKVLVALYPFKYFSYLLSQTLSHLHQGGMIRTLHGLITYFEIDI